MPSLPTLMYWEGLIIIGGLFAVVFWKMITGQIDLDELLQGDVRDPNSSDGYSSQASAGRAQTLVVTLFAALYYLIQVIQNPKEFPTLPTPLLGALAGSHAIYLGGKAQALLFGRLRDLLNRR